MELKGFNKSVNNRLKTVIKTIKETNNTFFDAFLNLLEATIKFILDEHDIYYDPSRTCSTILKTEEVLKFFFDEIKLDEKIYNKALDYIKKSNDSKHKEEKNIDLNAVLVRFEFFYVFINYYYDYISEEKIEFNSEYLTSLYGETARINNEYKIELAKKAKELEIAYFNKELTEEEYNKCKELLDVTQLEKLSIEEQNKILFGQINILNTIKKNINIEQKIDAIDKKINKLTPKYNENNINRPVWEKDPKQIEIEKFNTFKLISKKYYLYNSDTTLLHNKLVICAIGCLVLVLGIIATIICTIANKIYTTYTFFENIVLIQVLIKTIKTLKYDYKMSDVKLSKLSSYKYKFININYYEFANREKYRYKIMRIICYISCVLNILIVIESQYLLIIFIIEALLIASIVFFTYLKEMFEYNYLGQVLFIDESKNPLYNPLVFLYIQSKFVTYEEYLNKYKFKLKSKTKD